MDPVYCQDMSYSNSDLAAGLGQATQSLATGITGIFGEFLRDFVKDLQAAAHAGIEDAMRASARPAARKRARVQPVAQQPTDMVQEASTGSVTGDRTAYLRVEEDGSYGVYVAGQLLYRAKRRRDVVRRTREKGFNLISQEV